MKVIIHIGMMKTGSTSIQTWLSSNFVALEAEGVRSNSDAATPEKMIAHHMMKCAVFQTALHEFGADEQTAWLGKPEKFPGRESAHENCSQVAGQLEKLSEESSMLIYSNEHLFWQCNEIQMIALDRFLSRFFDDRTYVVYIRNVADFSVSMYSQGLWLPSRFAALEYTEFLEKCARSPQPFTCNSSGPFGKLLDWAKALEGKLNVRLLESDWLVNGDLIEDFASLIGIVKFDKPGIMNESFAAEYVEYVRFLNREFFRGGIPKKIRNEAAAILKKASAGKPKLVASDAQEKSVRALHREQEEKIRGMFFPDRPCLFSPRSRGCGVAPPPLTGRRKAEIESEIRENIASNIWPPRELALDASSRG